MPSKLFTFSLRPIFPYFGEKEERGGLGAACLCLRMAHVGAPAAAALDRWGSPESQPHAPCPFSIELMKRSAGTLTGHISRGTSAEGTMAAPFPASFCLHLLPSHLQAPSRQSEGWGLSRRMACWGCRPGTWWPLGQQQLW